MKRISMNDEGMFEPEEGELFFAHEPDTGIDRKVKALLYADGEACEQCVFHDGELQDLCRMVWCSIDDDSRLTFRRVSDGEI